MSAKPNLTSSSFKILASCVGILGLTSALTLPAMSEQFDRPMSGPNVRSAGEFHPNRPQISPNANSSYNGSANDSYNQNQNMAPGMNQDTRNMSPNMNQDTRNMAPGSGSQSDTTNGIPSPNVPRDPNLGPRQVNPAGDSSR